jgi:hypothetical protein
MLINGFKVSVPPGKQKSFIKKMRRAGFEVKKPETEPEAITAKQALKMARKHKRAFRREFGGPFSKLISFIFYTVGYCMIAYICFLMAWKIGSL